LAGEYRCGGRRTEPGWEQARYLAGAEQAMVSRIVQGGFEGNEDEVE
jgi:hypothetical protein